MWAVSEELWLKTSEILRERKKLINIFLITAEQAVIKDPTKFVLKVLITTYTKRDIYQKLRLSLMKISLTIETKRWQINQNQITNENFLAAVVRFWLLAQPPKNINKSKSHYKVLLSSFVKINFQYVTPIGIS